MKTVLVLEDDPQRMKWFREHFGTIVNTLHAPTAYQFAALQHQPHDLVIWDHDLDLTHNGGYNDYCTSGYDAAQAYPGRAPSLVWSWNDSGATRIKQSLMSRGIPTLKCRFAPTVEFARFVAAFLS